MFYHIYIDFYNNEYGKKFSQEKKRRNFHHEMVYKYRPKLLCVEIDFCYNLQHTVTSFKNRNVT